jgi:hypothetical protein
LAQDVARRVADVEDGTVRLTYPARPDVEICDQGIRMGDHRMWWNSKDDDGGPTNCRPGPVEVELDVRRGEVRDVDVIRDRNERTPGAVDLGEVSAPAAVAYFLELAEEGTHGAGEDVIFPAVLADVQDLWVELLAMARQESVRMGVRKSALFWVGQEAADAATEGLADLAFDEDEDQDVPAGSHRGAGGYASIGHVLAGAVGGRACAGLLRRGPLGTRRRLNSGETTVP